VLRFIYASLLFSINQIKKLPSSEKKLPIHDILIFLLNIVSIESWFLIHDTIFALVAKNSLLLDKGTSACQSASKDWIIWTDEHLSNRDPVELKLMDPVRRGAPLNRSSKDFPCPLFLFFPQKKGLQLCKFQLGYVRSSHPTHWIHAP